MANPGRKLDLTLPAMMDNAEAGNFINPEQEYDDPRLRFQRPGSVDSMIDGSDYNYSSSSVLNNFIDMSYNPGDRSDERLGLYYPDYASDPILTDTEDSCPPTFQFTVTNHSQPYAKATPEPSDHDDFIDPKLLHDVAISEMMSSAPSKGKELQSAPLDLTCQVCQKRFTQKALLQSVPYLHIS
jgi:hypothetical protein